MDDVMKMLEISQEAYTELDQKFQNVIDFQKRHAIQAILNGEVPEEVAQACGFNDNIGPFGQWLAQWLYDQIVS